jgi:hypothetical protein
MWLQFLELPVSMRILYTRLEATLSGPMKGTAVDRLMTLAPATHPAQQPRQTGQ